MPIIKITNIKGSQGHTSANSLKKAVDYIKDSKKTIQELNQERELVGHGIVDALTYTTNDVKTLEGHLVSGYLCDPELAESNFEKTRIDNLERVGKTIEDDSGNIGYHVVISWKSDEKITGQEAMDYGLEFMKRLGHHQAVVAVHTNTDNMHAHIVFNSHTVEPVLDYGAHDRMKYNDSKGTYQELRNLNDKMSLEKGYDVIKPRKHYEKSQSWFEHKIRNMTDEKGQPLSYKEALMSKIDQVKIVSQSYHGFERGLDEVDIDVRYRGQDNNISYKFKEEGQAVRASSLGQEYTRPALEAYFIEKESPATIKEVNHSELRELEEQARQMQKRFENELFINPRTNKRNRVSYYRSDGTQKSAIELLASLAIHSLRKNKEFIQHNENVYRIPTYKHVNMIDKKTNEQIRAMSNARKMGINDTTELSAKQKKVGKELYSVNRDLSRTNATLDKMQYLKDIIDKVENKEPVSNLEFNKLKVANLNTIEERDDFIKRYSENMLRAEILKTDSEKLRKEYGTLKRIESKLNETTDFKYIYEDLENYKKEVEVSQQDKGKDIQEKEGKKPLSRNLNK